MHIGTFEFRLLRNLLRTTICFSLLFAFAASARIFAGQETTLNLMPLPRSITMGAGSLNLSHFNAGFTGQHDARLDAALDRFLDRLDRQCGEIRRSQYQSRDAASYMLTVKVAGPGGAVQGPDEDEGY